MLRFSYCVVERARWWDRPLQALIIHRRIYQALVPLAPAKEPPLALTEYLGVKVEYILEPPCARLTLPHNEEHWRASVGGFCLGASARTRLRLLDREADRELLLQSCDFSLLLCDSSPGLFEPSL